MTLGFLLVAVALLCGFAVGRRFYQRQFERSRNRHSDESGDARTKFDQLSNDQQWLVARLVDEESFALADWNRCLESVLFVERDQTSRRRRIKPEYRDALARIVKDRQPKIRRTPGSDRLPRPGDAHRTAAGAFV
jgi:HAMP domain-containing protein